MNDAEIIARARIIQSHWDGSGDPVLIGHRENAVFKITTDTGPKALRLHRNGYQSHDFISGEMIWTEGLAATGFPCPNPLRTRDGAFIATLEDGQMATAVSWIKADPIGKFEGSDQAHEKLYFDLGTLLSQLHTTTDELGLAIDRPSWDLDALLGDNPCWGRFWENPSLTVSEVSLVHSARAKAAQHLSSLTDLNTGLIHADALQENVLSDNRLHLIDFDDSGYGYRLYELGVALIQHENSPLLPKLTQAICDGYGVSSDHMPLFMMLRSMASAGWVMSRADPTAPAQRAYAERMLRRIAAYQAA